MGSGEAAGYLDTQTQEMDTQEKKTNSRVFDSARVYDSARVFDAARVYDSARVLVEAQVYGSAMVYGSAQVSDSAQVYGSARVYRSAQVYGSARVHGCALISDSARVYGSAQVYDSAQVYGSATLDGRARCKGDDLITGHSFDYVYTGFLEAPEDDSPESDWYPVLRYGCERHPLKDWTPEFQAQLCAKHDEDAAEELRKIVRTVCTYFNVEVPE